MRAGGLSEEARFELSMAAAARERRNRPMLPTLVAALALVIGAVLALTGLTSKASAEAAYRRAVAQAGRTQGQLDEFARLSQGDSDMDVGAIVDKPISRIGQMAVLAGMPEEPRPPTETAQEIGGGTLHSYLYTGVHAEELRTLLDWLRQATEAVPGLEVYGLTTSPDPTGWKLTVTFRRWERHVETPSK